jgi:anhydro-N-acetylmuramic acid kinase
MGRLDSEIGELFAAAANALLRQSGLKSDDIRAIGSHGQTIRHRPSPPQPFTLQIGNPAVIAHNTGITTVADFRRADMAVGGQGAPLVPAFHNAVFRSREFSRVVVNIGGMANLTVIDKDPSNRIIGFDTGPGNVLINSWIEQRQQKTFDQDGQWAASGLVVRGLLELMLNDRYFSAQPPKSTGREHFHLQWIEKKLNEFASPVKDEDVQATLTELTAATITNDIKKFAAGSDEIYVCGGGVHNGVLMDHLRKFLVPRRVAPTSTLGIDPDFVEAATFAWLAKCTMDGIAGNLPSVTGARKNVVLGAIYPAE